MSDGGVEGDKSTKVRRTRTPPMVEPKPGKFITPIRHGERFNLGYDGSRVEAERYYVAPRGMGGAKKAARYPLSEEGWALAWRDFAQREPGSATDYWRQIEPPVEAARRAKAPAVPLLTIPTIPGREIAHVFGPGHSFSRDVAEHVF